MVAPTFCEFDQYWDNEGKKRFVIQWVASNFNAPAVSYTIPQRFLDLAKGNNIVFTNLRLRYNGQVGAIISRITLAYFVMPTGTEQAYVGTVLATTLDGQVISFDELNIPFFWDDGWLTSHAMAATVQSNYLATDDINIDLLGFIQQRGSEQFTTIQPSIPQIPKVTVEGVKFWRR